jgi:hypothetical protein
MNCRYCANLGDDKTTCAITYEPDAYGCCPKFTNRVIGAMIQVEKRIEEMQVR